MPLEDNLWSYIPTNDADMYMRHECPIFFQEVTILGINTLYSVFCLFKTLLPMQVWLAKVF